MRAAPITLHAGDCLEVAAGLPADSFDAIVTDPPYHLTSIVRRFGGPTAALAGEESDGPLARASRGFMGKEWDGGDLVFRPATWATLGRVLKPGGHLVAFNHSRTFHRMAVAIEDAGFEVRDSILDLYATGPLWGDFLDGLSPDQGRAFARAVAGGGGPLLAWLYGSGMPKSHNVAAAIDKVLGVEGEIIGRHSPVARWASDYADGMRDVSAREIRGIVSEAAKAFDGWGTALKPAFEPIVLARKPLAESSIARQHLATGTGGLNIDAARIGASGGTVSGRTRGASAGILGNGLNGGGAYPIDAGRWPANVTHDGSVEVRARFPVDAEGSVGRFFYSAKADAADRRGSKHPTVKPHALMRWLVRLVSARGGLILDPFGGSGATGWAAAAEGRRAVLIERDPDYAAHIARVIAGLEDPAGPHSPDDSDPSDRQPSLF
ncbi:DNA methyltransferase [Amaricoccus solimangrovi]|uniref:Methyltransferase n=1 Tax=Amaricoccus solimangrovi TaxID=2589815 RepID=A0A501WYJ0_9RHOB|nr:DNA methyltransferase [Amaricoccus solimangrovi]TPE52607.1 site-specific DNA-methyltransferase [Amaricoccus solimangrovi]